GSQHEGVSGRRTSGEGVLERLTGRRSEPGQHGSRYDLGNGRHIQVTGVEVSPLSKDHLNGGLVANTLRSDAVEEDCNSRWELGTGGEIAPLPHSVGQYIDMFLD